MSAGESLAGTATASARTSASHFFAPGSLFAPSASTARCLAADRSKRSYSRFTADCHRLSLISKREHTPQGRAVWNYRVEGALVPGRLLLLASGIPCISDGSHTAGTDPLGDL